MIFFCFFTSPFFFRCFFFFFSFFFLKNETSASALQDPADPDPSWLACRTGLSSLMAMI